MPQTKVFSVLDPTSGYWQRKSNEVSSKLCIFDIPYGWHHFTQLPFWNPLSPYSGSTENVKPVRKYQWCGSNCGWYPGLGKEREVTQASTSSC